MARSVRSRLYSRGRRAPAGSTNRSQMAAESKRRACPQAGGWQCRASTEIALRQRADEQAQAELEERAARRARNDAIKIAPVASGINVPSRPPATPMSAIMSKSFRHPCKPNLKKSQVVSTRSGKGRVKSVSERSQYRGDLFRDQHPGLLDRIE